MVAIICGISGYFDKISIFSRKWNTQIYPHSSWINNKLFLEHKKYKWSALKVQFPKRVYCAERILLFNKKQAQKKLPLAR